MDVTSVWPIAAGVVIAVILALGQFGAAPVPVPVKKNRRPHR
jgi:hypothetical protein